MTELKLVDSPYDFDYEMDYSSYGFDVKRVCDVRGNESDYKAIINTKTGEIVAIRGNNYKLLPNEVVLEASKQIADELGLEPFKLMGESIQSWRKWKSLNKSKNSDPTKLKKYNKVLAQSFVKNPHAVLDSSMTKMMALYTIPGVHDMDAHDQMQFGILIKNSIDGTTHLAVEGFSFRQICTNVSMYKADSIARSGLVSGYKMKHVKNVRMDFSRLKDVMSDVAKRTLDMKNVYGRWMVEDVKPKTVAAVGKNIPKDYLPDYFDKSGKAATLNTDMPVPTAWKVYNDLTEAIWHRPIEIPRKEALFSGLHGAFFKNQI